jgi:hypothetical protein
LSEGATKLNTVALLLANHFDHCHQIFAVLSNSNITLYSSVVHAFSDNAVFNQV